MAAVQPGDPKLARRLVAYLPHYAHLARHFASVLNLSNRIPLLRVLGGVISWLLPVPRPAGLAARRRSPAVLA